MSVMPKQKPGKSFQDYATPWEFIRAVENRFGKLDIDLAGSQENKKAPEVYTLEMDSLSMVWPHGKNLWLNPRFAKCKIWAQKCRDWHFNDMLETTNGRIFLLTPAAIGSNWFRDNVYGKALVLALNGRITFEGQTAPYPKDCILSCYGLLPGFEVWDWKKDI